MQKTLIKYPKGARIIISGQENPGFIYILKTGEIQIESKVQFIKNNLNHYSTGDCFGFVSGILHKRHQDNLIAASDCEIIKLSIESFIEHMKASPETFLKFLSSNSDKLRYFLNSIDDDSVRFSSNEFNPDKLYYNAKTYIKMGKNDIACYALKKYIIYNPKNQEVISSAEKLLKELNPFYQLPTFEEYVDGSGMLVNKNEIIFIENEPDDYFYLILSGAIKISKLIDGEEFNIDIIGKNEFFGEMAILNKKLRSATAIAHEDSVLLRLSPENLLEKLDTNILTKMFHQIARRLWLASRRFYVRQIDDINAQFYMMLSALVDDSSKPSPFQKNGCEIKITIEELGRMIGKKIVDKSEIKEFSLDPNLKISSDTIYIINKEVVLEKADILQKKHDRKMKEVII